ncbi:MAG: cytochrome c [Glaciecola sp.]|jgi:cytochrome c553
MKTTIAIGLLLSLVTTVSFADAYNKCIRCHGVNGERVALGKGKVIKDMTKADLEKSLLDYQNETYGGSMKGLMTAQVKNLSAADIKSIANKIGK